MGLESATYISQLVATNPASSDLRKQGDDHLRLLKAVLQATFPGAAKVFRFPSSRTVTANEVLTSTADNTRLNCGTAAGDLTLTLPTLGSGDAGWEIVIVKTSADGSAVLVVPASGTIAAPNGAMASVRVGVRNAACRIFWEGTAWVACKDGPRIGSVEEYYGASLPPGYVWADGSTINTTIMAELFVALGTNVLPDRRGRVAAARDNEGVGAAGRLSSATAVNAALGAETHTLSLSETPSHSHGNSLTDPGHTHTYQHKTTNLGGEGGSVILAASATEAATATSSAGTGITITNANAGGGAAHNNVQPTLVCNAIVRAC